MRTCAALVAFSLGLAAVASPSARWNGADVPLEKCRVSAMPFNRIWPGYQRPLNDPELANIGLIIFDEFHERNLAVDTGLALAHDARPLPQTLLARGSA